MNLIFNASKICGFPPRLQELKLQFPTSPTMWFYILLAKVFFNSVGLLLIRFIWYAIKRPIENVVSIVQTTKAINGGIIIKNLSSVTVSPTIRLKVVQIIKFTMAEYLKEVRSNDFPLLIF